MIGPAEPNPAVENPDSGLTGGGGGLVSGLTGTPGNASLNREGVGEMSEEDGSLRIGVSLN